MLKPLITFTGNIKPFKPVNSVLSVYSSFDGEIVFNETRDTFKDVLTYIHEACEENEIELNNDNFNQYFEFWYHDNDFEIRIKTFDELIALAELEKNSVDNQIENFLN